MNSILLTPNLKIFQMLDKAYLYQYNEENSFRFKYSYFSNLFDSMETFCSSQGFRVPRVRESERIENVFEEGMGDGLKPSWERGGVNVAIIITHFDGNNE